ncbi:MAG TPA: glycosyl hydrolase [Sphingomonas sp.]|nr:glycosyl hydrolase [Sphingomonas sp.]
MTGTRNGPGRRAVLAGGLLAGTMLGRPGFGRGLPRAEGGDPETILSLEAGFARPPASARPRAWWHWMNGNVTQDGIAKDLQWMHRIGIGGVHAFDVALATPQIVDRRLVYMSPEWRDAFRFGVQRAAELGMEMGVAASAGWSLTGGPWVTPDNAMKKVVWSEAVLAGGRRFRGTLPTPPGVAGAFQTLKVEAPQLGAAPPATPDFYRDSLVIAYPLGGPSPPAPSRPRYFTGDGKFFQGDALADEGFETFVELDGGVSESNSILLRYETPQTFRSLEFYAPGAFSVLFGAALQPILEASDDGRAWRRITDFPVSAAPTTCSFAQVTARWFRVRMAGPAGAAGGRPPGRITIARLRLSPDARINAFEVKAGYSTVRDYYELDAEAGPDVSGIDPDMVIDLTSRFRGGRLDWTPPPGGRWKVLRMGYALTGAHNHPAPPEATGLEVDKYDSEAVRDYLETYLGNYAETIAPGLFGSPGLQALIVDSTEVGGSNWTPRLIEHFRRLRGYDPVPWLPTLTGEIVGSRTRSDAFLYDYRRTLADLMASEHYGTIASVAHEKGLSVYAEALEAGRPVLGDDLEMRRFADIPMGALWSWQRDQSGPRATLLADIKGAASVAHVYGREMAAAESMTSIGALWGDAPSDLKRVVDLEFALGVNRIVIHTSPHQPRDDRQPGLSLMIFGQAFTRHETWAEMARPWIDYMARTSFLLQQGRDVADIAYFYGEEASPTALYQLSPVADAPRRHGFDFVGAHALLTLAKADGGDMVMPGGARYRAIYLGGTSRRMTVPVLRKLAELVRGGVPLIGLPPVSSPSLGDDPAEFAALVARLWSPDAAGGGRQVPTSDVEAGLAMLEVRPDFEPRGAASDAEIRFVHRRLRDGDLYFINNRKNRPERFDGCFRVTGKAAEIWRADAGLTEAVSYRIEGDITIVPLELLPEDAIFVVFRRRAPAAAMTIARPAFRPVADLAGPWTVGFQPGRGAPPGIVLAALQPLDSHPDPGIRYFSGVAAYRTAFRLAHSAVRRGPVLLDLGEVGDLAEVFVNGRSMGTVWKVPYRVEIATALRRGENQLEVRVANLWRNRIVGDLQPGASKVTFTSHQVYGPNTPLRRSGLIGPVRLLAGG